MIQNRRQRMTKDCKETTVVAAMKAIKPKYNNNDNATQMAKAIETRNVMARIIALNV